MVIPYWSFCWSVALSIICVDKITHAVMLPWSLHWFLDLFVTRGVRVAGRDTSPLNSNAGVNDPRSKLRYKNKLNPRCLLDQEHTFKLNLTIIFHYTTFCPEWGSSAHSPKHSISYVGFRKWYSILISLSIGTALPLRKFFCCKVISLFFHKIKIKLL